MSERRALPDARDAGTVTIEASCVVIVGGCAAMPTLELIVRMGGAAAVHTVSDVRLAAARCRELRPDLVLIDVEAANVDGVELLVAIRRALAEEQFVPVMVLGGRRVDDAWRAVPPTGAVDVVSKPFDPVELVGRVRNLLTMRRLYSTVAGHNAEVRSQV